MPEKQGIREYESDEVAMLFPPMNGPTFEQMKADVAERGFVEKGTICEGKLLDGRNRQRIAIALGVPFPVEEYDGDRSTMGKFQFVVSKNLHRRHLTESQRAILAARSTSIYEKIAAENKERMREGAKKGGESKGQELVPEPSETKGGTHTREQVGKMFNVSGSYVSRAAAIDADNPTVGDAILAGEKTITEAQAEAKRAGLIESAKPKAKPSEGDGAKTILIHKAWDMGGNDPTFVERVGKGIELGERAGPNCHLYLHCEGNDSLLRAVALVALWGSHGFRLKQILTLKKKAGKQTAHFNDSTELLLFLVRGKLDLSRPNPEPFIDESRMHKMLESLSPSPRLEIFSTAEHAGWAS